MVFHWIFSLLTDNLTIFLSWFWTPGLLLRQIWWLLLSDIHLIFFGLTGLFRGLLGIHLRPLWGLHSSLIALASGRWSFNLGLFWLCLRGIGSLSGRFGSASLHFRQFLGLICFIFLDIVRLCLFLSLTEASSLDFRLILKDNSSPCGRQGWFFTLCIYLHFPTEHYLIPTVSLALTLRSKLNWIDWICAKFTQNTKK